MLRSARFLLLMTIFAYGVVGCAPPDDNGGFDDDGVDSTTSSGGKADGYHGSVCANPTGPQYALGGTILTPDGPLAGYVVVDSGRITAVTASRDELPATATVVETGGIVSPGFIDLHNHIAYNFLPLWNAGRRFGDRYQWARTSGYAAAVKAPYNAVKRAGDQCDGLKYGEFRALVGGTTSIQGSVQLSCGKGWVRNVEFSNFCEDHVRQDVLPIKSIRAADAARLNAQFASGQTRAFLVHLAEGVDATAHNEFEQLRALDLLKPQVVGIHSTGLDEAQLTEMGQIGMKIVWSPLSNLILYGKTTNIPAALRAGVKIALAPDWAPSGSSNVLGELKVADRVNREQFGGMIDDHTLWQMVTENPADIIGFGDKLGRIAPGYYADLVVIRGDGNNPYRAIIDAQPADVLLTAISGEPLYGSTDLLSALGQTGQYTDVDACGEARELRVVDSTVPRGSEQLSDVLANFAKDGESNPVSLFQCEPAPEWAFAGTSM